MEVTDVRLSPDGKAVAIRSQFPEDGNMAYGVMNAQVGGYWMSAAKVADWTPMVPASE